jgi:hypothetical protein
MTLFLQPGDTLISSKRLLESALVLCNQPPKFLPDILSQDESLRVSVAFLIESIVLHEKLLCISSEDTFRTLVLQSGLAKLLTLLRPISYKFLVSELKDQGHLDAENVNLGYARMINSPTLVLNPEYLASFNQAFPALATETEDAAKVKLKYARVSLREAMRRHFSHYETVASLALGIAHSLASQEFKSGYNLYQERVLTEIKQIAEARASQLNPWLQRNHFSIEAPLVFSYVVKRSESKQDILSVAMDLRNSKEATAFRKQSTLFDQALKDGDDKTIVEMIEEMQDKTIQLSRRIKSPQLKLDISFPLSITISPTEIWEHIKNRRKRHLIFVSHLYEVALFSRDVNAHFNKLF